MLEVNSICIDIDDVPLIKNLSFTIEPSKLLHLKGKNGAGKTTLLRSLIGLHPLSSGTISFKDSLSQSDIGYIGHKPSIEPLLTVEENLIASALGEEYFLDSKVALEKLNLISHCYKFADQLSQGQKKRLSLAKFLMLKKSLWLLDEPFSALDFEHQIDLRVLISSYIKSGGSVIITSHLPLEFEGIHWSELSL